MKLRIIIIRRYEITVIISKQLEITYCNFIIILMILESLTNPSCE